MFRFHAFLLVEREGNALITRSLLYRIAKCALNKRHNVKMFVRSHTLEGRDASDDA
jgi:hypothetical protein